MYVQRYVEHFPAAGEIVVFDRSWYNRIGVEKVMGLASPKDVERFLSICSEIKKYITDAGIVLIKFWLEVGQEEQEKRFLARINDPLRRWKLSPMDLESHRTLVRLFTRPRQARYTLFARTRSTSASAASFSGFVISEAWKPLRTIATISSRPSDRASETAR